MTNKIQVKDPLIELSGDEMALIMWNYAKKKIFLPFLDIKIHHFDLSIQHREATKDVVTTEAAKALMLHGAGVKCATITPTPERVKEFNLSNEWPSPNGTVRNIVDGTIFRAPIVISTIPRLMKNWKEPVMIARHGFGDQYKAKEFKINTPGTLSLVFTPTDGSATTTLPVNTFNGNGVSMAMFNTEKSITSFANSCFNMALSQKIPLIFGAKHPILKIYDTEFKNIFAKLYDTVYAEKFQKAGITYSYGLIDDVVAKSVAKSGGYLWACKNYDGDVQSDYLAAGYGSLGLMTSILTSPDGKVKLAEAAHGTVTAHFRRLQQIQASNGELENDISTNPIASIFAWTGGLRHRGELDKNNELIEFCNTVEQSVIKTVESGTVTRDLAKLIHDKERPSRATWVTTEKFIDTVAALVEESAMIEA